MIPHEDICGGAIAMRKRIVALGDAAGQNVIEYKLVMGTNLAVCE